MDTIDRLEATKVKTLAYYDLGDDQLEQTYEPGKWTVRYLLHHLADAETVLYDRIRRVISEPRPVVWAFDQDAWAQGLNYARQPLALSRSIFKAARTGVIYQAQQHYARIGHLEFVHSETGVRTLKDEFDKVVWHNEHHLDQIKRALASSAYHVS